MQKSITYIILLVFLFYGTSIVAQQSESNSVQEYLKSKSLTGTSYPYIYSYTTLAGKMVEHYLYYKKEGNFTLVFFNSGSNTIKEKHFETDTLFQIVHQNLKYLKSLSYKKTDNPTFRKKFTDSTEIFNQIGIRYKSLHYNHFQQSPLYYSETIENKKLKEGYITLDSIAMFFKEQF